MAVLLVLVLIVLAAAGLVAWRTWNTTAIPPDVQQARDEKPNSPWTDDAQTPAFAVLADSSAPNAAVQLPTLDDGRDGRNDRLMDPQHDGWDSEVSADKAKKNLLKIFKSALSDTTSATDEEDAIQLSRPLRPETRVVFQQPGVQVLRADDSHKETHTSNQGRGSASLPTAIRQLLQPLARCGPVHLHVKVVRVQLDSEKHQVNTTSILEAHSHCADSACQLSGNLHCQWERSGADYRLLNMELREFEETRSSKPRWFADCTQAVFGQQPAFQQQIGLGTNYWMQRVERTVGMDDTVRKGLAIGDANGDGRDDVYICQGPGLPNRLLLQSADGTVQDVAADWGVDWLDNTSSALFVDLDNDGDQDMAIATSGGLLIMENQENYGYRLRRQLAEQNTDVQSLVAADYDSDGDLDLFLCAYRDVSGRLQGDFVFHDATTGGRNFLFANQLTPEWEFADVTQSSGLAAGGTRYTLAAAWEDYDNDGDPDLYIANDYGRNFLFRNTGGRLQDVSASVGLLDTGFGMSVAWGDYNRDGWMDLYIGNMFSSAGSRITRQAAFQADASPEQRALYQRLAKGNSLFRNQAGTDGTQGFYEVSRDADVEMGRWAWSSVFADLNNDGWEDLLIANGYITTEDTGDL